MSMEQEPKRTEQRETQKEVGTNRADGKAAQYAHNRSELL